jgi:hypothetical protein
MVSDSRRITVEASGSVVVRGEMPLEPRASWFSPKCAEVHQLIGHLGVKHSFGAGCASSTKSRLTLNTS